MNNGTLSFVIQQMSLRQLNASCFVPDNSPITPKFRYSSFGSDKVRTRDKCFRIPNVSMSHSSVSYTAVMLVPTGIGAGIGGFAGDAIPAARLLASAVDTLITHPNVLNGALMYWPITNALYVEGFAIDQFASGKWGLLPSRKNIIGLLIDKNVEPELLHRHIQACNAARATLGVSVTKYVVTDEPINVDLSLGDTGISWGTIANPKTVLKAAKKLINQGCDAIAVVARFPDDEDEEMLDSYRHGEGVDAIGGAEAVISHLIVREFGIPCAHAPALSPLPVDITISPKSCAEELGYTFLSCVLVGLSRAPTYTTDKSKAGAIWADDVDAIIVPESAVGSISVLELCSRDTLIITVKNNETVLNVTPEKLGLRTVSASSYFEAAGILLADKEGIDFASISPNVPNLEQL